MLFARLQEAGQLSRGVQDRDLAAANCRQPGASSRQEPAYVILEDVGGAGGSFNKRRASRICNSAALAGTDIAGACTAAIHFECGVIAAHSAAFGSLAAIRWRDAAG